jgi:hypothetical protein
MASVTDIEKKTLVLNYCKIRMGQITRGDVYEIATRCGYLKANGDLSDSGQSLSQVLAATDRVMKVAC